MSLYQFWRGSATRNSTVSCVPLSAFSGIKALRRLRVGHILHRANHDSEDLRFWLLLNGGGPESVGVFLMRRSFLSHGGSGRRWITTGAAGTSVCKCYLAGQPRSNTRVKGSKEHSCLNRSNECSFCNGVRP